MDTVIWHPSMLIWQADEAAEFARAALDMGRLYEARDLLSRIEDYARQAPARTATVIRAKADALRAEIARHFANEVA